MADGLRTEAAQRIERAEALPRSAGSPWMVATALAARGLVELERGAPASAALEEAAELVLQVHRDAEIHRAVGELREGLGS